MKVSTLKFNYTVKTALVKFEISIFIPDCTNLLYFTNFLKSLVVLISIFEIRFNEKKHKV